MTSNDELLELRSARAEVERLKAEIRAEMLSKAREGHLWSNGQCRAWDAYERAEAHLSATRERVEAGFWSKR